LVVWTKALAINLPADEIEELARAVHIVNLGKVPVFVGPCSGRWGLGQCQEADRKRRPGKSGRLLLVSWNDC
jgi:hypothetical protein